MSATIYDAIPTDAAPELERLARLVYETREHRRAVLQAVGAPDEQTLLERIIDGGIGEHPAYEHYLAARILADTHQAAREAMAASLTELNRR